MSDEIIAYQLVFSDGRTSSVLYSKDEADRFKKASDITVDIRALYAAPPAPSVAVKSLQWDDDGDNLKARMGDREWMLNITSDGKTWAGSTRPFVFGRNLTWSSVPNCSMVSLEEAKAACQADCQSRYVALSAQVQDVAGWQPIETAPKDGTPVILWTVWVGDEISPDPFSEVQIGYWDHGNDLPESHDFSRRPEWVVQRIGEPTHWMPLPAAPVKQEGGHDWFWKRIN